MTISLKAGSGSSPWYTIDSPSQAEEREALLLFAGLTEESEVLDRGKVANLSLMELTVLTSQLFQVAERTAYRSTNAAEATEAAQAATVPPASGSKQAAASKAAPKGGDESQADPARIVEEEIAAAESKAELTTIHGRHRQLFADNPKLMALLRARSEEVK